MAGLRLLLSTTLLVLAAPGVADAAKREPKLGFTVTDPSLAAAGTVYAGERGSWSWVSGAEYRVAVSLDNSGRSTARGVVLRARGTGIESTPVEVGTARRGDDFQLQLPVTLTEEDATVTIDVRNRRNRVFDRRVIDLTAAPAPAPPAVGRWAGTATDAAGRPQDVAFGVDATPSFTGFVAALTRSCSTVSDPAPQPFSYPNMGIPRSNVFERTGTVRRDGERIERVMRLRFTSPTTAEGSLTVYGPPTPTCPASIAFSARWVAP